MANAGLNKWSVKRSVYAQWGSYRTNRCQLWKPCKKRSFLEIWYSNPRANNCVGIDSWPSSVSLIQATMVYSR